MGRNYLHIWPRENYMLIALPNLDGSFTCTLFYPYQGEDSFENLKTEEDVVKFFQRVFPDALQVMPTLVEDFFANPVGSLVTVRCNPWRVGGQVCLLGDASHAIVPFFGQGMNSGFEDCRVLGDLMKKHQTGSDMDWSTLFREFNDARKENADAIADLALENFVEMRDKTADPLFQLKKKVGFELETR
ncbi:MAG TPA: kynurenine 3-monooxygenase, partial [Phycisphaerales bacterium]|nr:kynurenine 3-monooxygenase [Phycisphaerales bacterium]